MRSEWSELALAVCFHCRVADDHYFLYGSLASGRRTYFVSNDMLGDHTAHSVSPDLVPVFRRWQRSRQVTMEAAPPSLRGRGRLQDTLKVWIVPWQ